MAGLPEHKIRVISPDIGGGFGNKVPIYPGYVCAIVGSLLLGKPVKWMEDRSENLTSTGFARDYIMVGEIAATDDGKILAIRSNVLADHGAFNGTAAPVKYPAGFFGVFTGSYDIEAAYCHMTAVYTNKAPGGVAYACSFRITEAVYFVERLVDCLAFELKMDPAQLRLQNLLKPDQFPYKSKTGWVYDSGDYETTMRLAMDMIGYDALRAEQDEKRERGELMGIGMSFFTEAVGAGPRKDMDILGLGMADGCELRVHPTGKAVVRLSVQTQGQGHETTFAQIVAEELGIPPDDIDVVHGDTDQTPFGLGTYGSRSTPVSGAAAALVARKVRDKAKIIAVGHARGLDRRPGMGEGVVPRQGRPVRVGDDPGHRDARARRRRPARGPGGRPGRPDLLQPGESHLPVRGVLLRRRHRSRTAVVKVRRFLAVDDCGTRINPMIIEGQIHGGITDGIGMALMEIIAFDEEGNCLGGSLMDYLIPTALEVPNLETGFTVTPSPHHPIGAKGIGESATVGSPPAVVNAVVDALAPFGVRHADMPLTPSRVWEAMQGRANPADLKELHDDDERTCRAIAAGPHAVRACDGRARRNSPPRRTPAMRRSCWWTAQSRDSSAVTARRTPCARRRWAHCRRTKAYCCGCCPTAMCTFRKRRAPASSSTRVCPAVRWRSILTPQVPAPLMRICGSTPISDAVAQLCALLGYDIRRDDTERLVRTPPRS